MTSRRGDLGLGSCIAYFTARGCIVSIPLSDSQPYDLVVQLEDGKLCKIQIKTTARKNRKNYVVGLRTCSYNGWKKMNGTKLFDPASCDFLYVLVETGDKYLIPIQSFKCVSDLTLDSSRDCFKV